MFDCANTFAFISELSSTVNNEDEEDSEVEYKLDLGGEN